MIRFRLIAAFLLTLMLLLTACGGTESTGTGSTDTDSGSTPLAGLEPVPEPPLAGLPEVAGQQIAAQRQVLNELDPGATADSAALASAYGRLGELYHAYDLTRPAQVAYGNASVLESKNARWLYLSALAHQKEGKLEQAANAFAQALELEPADPAALLHLAEIRMTLADLDAAAELYERVLAVKSEETAAVFGRGRIAEAQGELEVAASAYEEALAAQPSAKNLHSLLASLYRRLDKLEAAEDHLAEFGGGTVVFEDPIFDEMKSLVGGIGPMLDAALSAYGDEDYLLAAERYLEVLEVDAANSTALSGAATSLRKGGQLEKAIQIFERFVKADPENRVAQLELATSQLEFGDLEAALDRFRELILSSPDFEQAHFNYAVALSRAERWPESIKSFRTALELEPRNQTARFHLALALEQTGSVDAALATLERAVQEAPSFVRARQRLGNLLEARGRLEAASAQFQAVAEFEEAPLPERALAQYQLGRLAALRNQPEQAVRHFERAVEWMPDLWQAHIALGRRHAAARRDDKAAAAFARAVEINPEHVAARVEQAQSLIAAGQYIEARRQLEVGLRALPRAAEIAHGLARLLATAPEEKVRDGRRALELANGVLQAYPWPVHAETYVMALAELGRFDEAAARQQQLIAGAQEEGREADLPRLQAHYQGYIQQQPARLTSEPPPKTP